MNWPNVKLKDISTKIGSGATPRGGKDSYRSDGIPLIRSLNIYDFVFSYDDLAYLNDEQARQLDNVIVEKNDILLNITGASVARCCMVPENLVPARVNQHVSIIRINPSIADPYFVYYAINSPLYKIRLLNLAQGGATREALTKEKIENFEVPLPELKTQNKIGSILCSYDDLIENNTRRIQILEEMAQAIYREWFVHFRYPGHETARMIESELGLIPEGWEIISYKDLLESYRGGDWGEENPTDKENCAVYVIRGTDFDDMSTGLPLRVPKRFISKDSLLKRGLSSNDIIIENSVNASSRCTGKSMLITEGILRRFDSEAICASFCKCFRLKRPSLAPLVLMHLRDMYQSGKLAYFQHVAANGIGNFQAERFTSSVGLILPEDVTLLEKMLATFSSLTSSIYADQNYNLRQQRDLLLPRLISGELNIQHVDNI